MLEGLVSSLLNRFLGAYIENFDPKQLNVGIWSGDVKLRNLKLKREALDKFRLPIDACEGYVGDLTLSIPWSNLARKPVKVVMENIFLLATPKMDQEFDEEDDKRRAQAVKQEKLDSSEILQRRQLELTSEDTKKNQSFAESLTTKIIDNLQITVRNIHIRYEDSLSSPGNPFSVGVTLAEFSALSTDSSWQPAFVQGNDTLTYKLAKLNSLAVYWNTDAVSIAGKDTVDMIRTFDQLISKQGDVADHQYVLRPVNGEGKVTMNKLKTHDQPGIDIGLLFDEIAFAIDQDQYRDAIMMVDTFHFFLRHQEYRKYRPKASVKEDPRAWLKFGFDAVHRGIHERRKVWTWQFMKDRRDKRKHYIKCYKLKQTEKITLEDSAELKKLEEELVYEDIRFYRSLAKNELRKENALKPKQVAQQAQGWLSWAWSGAAGRQQASEQEETVMTDEQRKELYEAIEWDEKQALAEGLEAPEDSVKMQVTARLKTGSFALKKAAKEGNDDVIKLLFDTFGAQMKQRPTSFFANMALASLRLIDGTTPGSLFTDMAKLKDGDFGNVDMVTPSAEAVSLLEIEDPLFYASFESHPLSRVADTEVIARLKAMEIIYNPVCIETFLKFIKPPKSQIESINALMEVASEAAKDYREQGRASLEFALSEHKTVAAHLDLQAPLIIVPESVTRKNAPCIILDAGKIHIESDLVKHDKISEIQSKDKEKLSEMEMQELQSLCYDKFMLRLEDTQILIGPDIEQSLAALRSNSDRRFHVVDRINMNFLLEISILPKEASLTLTKFRISGHLPSLNARVSDQKYKTMMRIIDIAVPKDDQPAPPPTETMRSNAAKAHERRKSTAFRSAFSRAPDLVVFPEKSDDDDADEDEKFLEAREGPLGDKDLLYQQKAFELEFTVGELKGSLYKASAREGEEDEALVDVVLQQFALQFFLRQYDMQADVVLRSLVVEDRMNVESPREFQKLVTSEQIGEDDQEQKDLVHVKYTQVKPESPEFQSTYGGIDKHVDVALSTINVIVTQKSILTLFDFVLTTFTSPDTATEVDSDEADLAVEAVAPPQQVSKMRVKVELTSIVLILNHDGLRLATIKMSKGDVGVFMNGGSMRVGAKIGNFSVRDDVDQGAGGTSTFRQIISIQGDELVDFRYETFDPLVTGSYPGYDSSVYLRLNSIKINFLEEPVRKILNFGAKFARMKALFDEARQAAMSQVQQVQQRVGQMHFDILIRTPIVVFPRVLEKTAERDVIVANLGELFAHNEFAPLDDRENSPAINRINAGIRNIALSSKFHYQEDEAEELQMIDDADALFDIKLVERGVDSKEPETQVSGHVSDISLKLTRSQYKFLMALTRSVPGVFVGDGADEEERELSENLSGARSRPSSSDLATPSTSAVVDLEPELGHSTTQNMSSAMDAVLTVGTLSLEIFEDSGSKTCGDLEKASLSKFLLSTTKAKFATRSDGSSQGEINVKALTVLDTRHDKPSKFREVIPPVKHDGHQFNASVTVSGGIERALMAMLTVDTPRIIFSLEHVFALQHWAMSAFEADAEALSAQDPLTNTDQEPEATLIQSNDSEHIQDLANMTAQTKAMTKTAQPAAAKSNMSIAYRVNVVDPSIILVANPASSSSEAIMLSARQVLLTQQTVMMLEVDGISMYLCRMDKPDSLRLRLLDDFAINLSLDSRTNSAKQTIQLIEIGIEPLVLRVSLRDILIALQIAQKASQLSAGTAQAASDTRAPSKRNPTHNTSTRRRSSAIISHAENKSNAPNQTLVTRIKDNKTTRIQSSDQDGIVSTIINREELKATFQGLRLILIGDLHELPILDMNISKFLVNIRDWSSDMTLDTNLEAYANVYNFSNSHWEPLIEPWQMGVHIARSVSTGRSDVNLYSRKRIEITLTSSTIALASKAIQYFNQNEDVLSKPRGVDAPYRIINMTGYPLSIWSEGDETTDTDDGAKLADGEEIPWSFSDWHFQRESLSVEALYSHLGIKIDESDWDVLADVPVNRQGEKLYALKSTAGAQSSPQHRIVVEVKLRSDYVKVVTIRSALLFENRTKIPVEVVGIDQAGNKQTKIYKIAPDEDCALPIKAAFDCGIKIRPDPGFRYQWSHQTLYWKELVSQPGRTLNCKPLDSTDSTPFNFQIFSRTTSGNLGGKYPYQRIRISPPVEINNLLPYDFNFKIYDDTVKKDWSNFLRKGLRSPVHTVDLAHVLLLAVKVQESQPAYEPSQYSVIHTNNPDDFRREEKLVLIDATGMKTKLGLHFTEVADSGGAFVVSVYAPYLLLNKTGLDIQIRSANSMFLQKSRNGTGVIPSDKEKSALPYLHSYAHDDRKNRALLRVGNSSWSSPQSFEAIGSVSEVTLAAPNEREIHLGIKVDEGEGKYKLTKVVTLTPRFVLKSNLSQDLMIREPASSDIIYLKAGDLTPIHFMRQVVARQLSLCLPGADNDWSNPFNIQDVGRIYVKVQRRGEHQKLLKIEILLEGATLFLHINQEDTNWPFIIRNESSCDFIYYQGNPYIEDGEETGKRVPYKPQRYKIPARSIMPYAWDYPAAKSPILILSPTRDDARVRHLRLSEIGALEPFKVPADPKRQTNGGVVDLNVVADGPTRKLIIKNRDPKTSLYRQRTMAHQRDKLLRTDSSSSMKAEFEAVVDSKAAEPTLKANLRFEGIGLSLINSRHKELAYLTLRGIEFTYSDSAAEQTYDLICKWIQIDNQLYGGIYPILLYPTVIPKTGREVDLRPAFHQKFILAKDTSHGVFFVKYASVLMQEFTLEVDEDFLFALLDFSKVPGASWSELTEGELCDASLTLPEPNREAESNDVYFEVLHLHPFSLNLSFVRTERVNVEDKTSSQNPLMFFFNILTMAVGNINEAPVRLNALLMENVLTSYPMLSQAIQSHYGEEFFFQVHKILGSADFLGNPVGLFNNITSGFADIFYEPYQGFILSDRRGEIPIGIAKGTASFVKKTVFGISDSFSKVTGSVSKGLSVATMDKQFQEKRRLTKARNRPKHALYGVQSGGMALLSSFGSGVEGLARQPFEGAEKEGAAGFFKGVGKGVLGLVTKPVVGVFDLASNVGEGIRNTTTVFDSEGIDKVRLPRHIGRDGVVRPYNENEALGLFWLQQLNNGKFQKESYLAHYNLTDGTMLLITYDTIMLCKLKGFNVEWDIAFADLKTILMEKEGLKLILKGNQRGPLIPIREESGRKFVYSKIKIAVQAYNSQ